MRTGDAGAEIWLEADSRRLYFLLVWSIRRGRRNSDRWKHPTFKWRCEAWGLESAALEDPTRTEKGECDTYQDAERCARRAADQLEFDARKATR